MKQYFVICVALVLFTGCSDYLDLKSNSTLATPNTLDVLQKLLDESNIMNFSTNSYAESSADNYFIPPDTYGFLDVGSRLVYTWENYDYEFTNDWAVGYTPVYVCNTVLENLGDIPRSADNAGEWDNVAGSAYFFRAHAYLHLVWTYAMAYDPQTAKTDLGIVIRQTSSPYELSKRSSVYDCYQAIIEDIKKAIGYLPERSIHVLRPSKLAAYGLMARAYLSMSEFDMAKNYADSLLLLNDVLIDYNELSASDRQRTFPFDMFNKETLFYTQMINYSPNISYSVASVDTLLYDSYDEADIRKEVFFNEGSQGYFQFRGNYSGSTNLFSGITTAEMYLIRAECNARSGVVGEALSDLNRLLENRYSADSFSPVTLPDTDQLLERILLERRKELLFRGMRWTDIKRLNMLGAEIVLQRLVEGELIELMPNENRYALPLPVDIINITGMEQNPI